jgi:hypothetical protein
MRAVKVLGELPSGLTDAAMLKQALSSLGRAKLNG